MIEFLVEFIFEFLFQMVFEIIGALLDGRFAQGLVEIPARVLKGIFYLLLGFGLGYVSYVLLPHTISGNPPNALLTVGFVPAAVGVVCVFVARWMERRWDWEVGLSRFIYSFIFAWSFAASRYLLLVS